MKVYTTDRIRNIRAWRSRKDDTCRGLGLCERRYEQDGKDS